MYMLDTYIFFIVTHLLAFVLGACCMILFYSFFASNRQHSKSEDHHNSHQVNGTTSNRVSPSKKEDKSTIAHKADIVESKETSEPKQRKPLPTDLRNEQRKEEISRKRQEEISRKPAFAEVERMPAFNLRLSKPGNISYTNLGVSDGKLVPCSIGQTFYYHYWEYEGRYFYEFFCEPSEIEIAVNNRSAIIDPFCQKDSDSVDADEFKELIIKEFGELDSKLNIISKSIISYQ